MERTLVWEGKVKKKRARTFFLALVLFPYSFVAVPLGLTFKDKISNLLHPPAPEHFPVVDYLEQKFVDEKGTAESLIFLIRRTFDLIASDLKKGETQLNDFEFKDVFLAFYKDRGVLAIKVDGNKVYSFLPESLLKKGREQAVNSLVNGLIKLAEKEGLQPDGSDAKVVAVDQVLIPNGGDVTILYYNEHIQILPRVPVVQPPPTIGL